ncbi:hypothetical protein ACFQVC_23660 [Streptomyces monticola]|uniref:Lipoprotein n=1 Tax=Streptomyces monticola TaxID=2666263 RepID=A0ABW2JM29_9ACTN
MNKALSTGIAVLLTLGVSLGAGGCTADTADAGDGQRRGSRAPDPAKPSKSSPSERSKDMRRLMDTAGSVLPDVEDRRFVAGGAGDLKGTNMVQDDATTRGKVLVVQLACAGHGSATVTVTSGRSKAVQRVSCGEQPLQKNLRLTSGSERLELATDPAEGAAGALAYRISTRD